MTTTTIEPPKKRDGNVSFLQWLFNFERLEKYAVVVMLFAMSGGFFNHLILRIPVTLFYWAAIALAIFVFRYHIPYVIRAFISNIPLMIVTFFVIGSILWSQDFGKTFEPVTWYVYTLLIGLYIALRFSFEEQVDIWIWMAIISAVLGLLFVFAVPSIGIHQDGPHVGSWRGVFVQKNIFTRYISIGAVLTVVMGHNLGRFRWPAFGLMMLCIFGSTSGNALISFLIMIMLASGMWVLRARADVLTGLMLSLAPYIIGVLIVVLANYAAILEAFGEDPTLTGRIPLWEVSVRFIFDKPITGWGYWSAAFSDGAPIFDYLKWQDAPFAHNNWVDMALDIGIIATMAYTFMLLQNIWRGVGYARRNRTARAWYPFLFVIHVSILTAFTRMLIATSDIATIMFFAATFSLTIDQTYLSKLPVRRPYPYRDKHKATEPEAA